LFTTSTSPDPPFNKVFTSTVVHATIAGTNPSFAHRLPEINVDKWKM
jgi:hypothetical protein